MTVLLTGATGFLGRHCLAALRHRGYEVHAAARSRCTSPLRPVPKPGASGDSSAMRARPRVRSLEACSSAAVGGGEEFRRVDARPRRGKSAGEQESPLCSSSGRAVRARESARRMLVEAPASRRRPRGVACTACGGGIDAGRCASGRRGVGGDWRDTVCAGEEVAVVVVVCILRREKHAGRLARLRLREGRGGWRAGLLSERRSSSRKSKEMRLRWASRSLSSLSACTA